MNECREVRLGDFAKFIDYRGKTPRKTASGILFLIRLIRPMASFLNIIDSSSNEVK